LRSEPDGNCLFHTISILLKGDQSLSTQLRVRAAYTLIAKREKFWILNLNEKSFSLADEVAKTFREGEWGGETQIMALAQVLRRDIVILHAHVGERSGNCPLKDCIKNHRMMHQIYRAESREDERKFLILFSPVSHRSLVEPNTLPNHFSPIVRFNENSANPDILSQISNIVSF